MFSSLNDISRRSQARRPLRLEMATSSLVTPQEHLRDAAGEMTPEEMEEALGDFLARAGKSVSRAAKRAASRIKGIFKKKAEPKALPKPEKPEPKIKDRVKAKVRPKGPPGGITPRTPPPPPEPVKPPVTTTTSITKPRPPVLSKKDLDAARKAAKKDQAAWPANWDTTAAGAPVSRPKGTRATYIQRGLGPKGRPGKFKPAVSHSAMYQHVVRAIYVNGTQRGYAFRESPAVSSQKIARAKMIKWGYAKRATKKGGITDRRRIALTGKGSRRTIGHHAKEPPAVLKAKSQDYANIVRRGPT